MNALFFIKFAAFLVALWFVYLLFWPVNIDPQAWQPPKSPMLEGDIKPNHYLSEVERLPLTNGEGPEDVALDSASRIYGGLQDGRIIRFDAQGKNQETFTETDGRPLGLHFDQAGNLIVADAYKGLLSVNPQGKITTLTTQSNGIPFRFTDDLDIAEDGIIYFSDASHKYSQTQYKSDALEHRPNGRLLSYDPESGQTTTLLSDLYFANGVAVSPDQSFVLVNETWNYRVLRYWLKGEKKGQSEVFIDQLPGFPDGISSGENGIFWLALASPRDPILDKLAPYPWTRKIVQRLPAFMHPAPRKYGFVLGLNKNGEIIHNLQEPSGKPYSVITSVQAEGDILYLGSLEENAIGRIAAP